MPKLVAICKRYCCPFFMASLLLALSFVPVLKCISFRCSQFQAFFGTSWNTFLSLLLVNLTLARNKCIIWHWFSHSFFIIHGGAVKRRQKNSLKRSFEPIYNFMSLNNAPSVIFVNISNERRRKKNWNRMRSRNFLFPKNHT